MATRGEANAQIGFSSVYIASQADVVGNGGGDGGWGVNWVVMRWW